MKTKIISQLVYLFIRTLNFTYRYKFSGLENKQKAIQLNSVGTYVIATWHQTLIGGILSHIGGKYTMIVSGSKDGELVAVTCEKLGFFPARGSSTRGGKEAMLELIKKMKTGIPGAITVDGPKGPVKVVKPGVIEVARICQCAILPMYAHYENFWQLNKAWDKFKIPKPFSKITVCYGSPLLVEENISREKFEEFALTLAASINSLEQPYLIEKSL